MEHNLVVDGYRAGDADRRLALFLYYRDLREEFILVEEQLSNRLKPLRSR